MDRQLLGTLALGAACLPWVVEVCWQVRLQARFLRGLAPEARAALPRHPQRPGLAFLAPARFHLAFWRQARRDGGDDAPEVLALKRQIRASLRRELVWSAGGLGTLAALLLAYGWRPIWP